MANPNHSERRILNGWREFCARYGGSRITWWRRLKSDPSFPRPLDLGGPQVAFLIEECDEYFTKVPRRYASSEAEESPK